MHGIPDFSRLTKGKQHHENQKHANQEISFHSLILFSILLQPSGIDRIHITQTDCRLLSVRWPSGRPSRELSSGDYITAEGKNQNALCQMFKGMSLNSNRISQKKRSSRNTVLRREDR